MKNNYLNSLEILGIFFASFSIFIFGISSQEIVGFDARFYLFALEMWQKGLSFFPTTYYHPYPDYPATSTAIIYFTAKIFGGLNKFTAVLPTAILAAATLAVTYMIGALHSKRWGLVAIFLMFTTLTFLKGARGISLDMYTTFFSATSFYLVYSADQLQKTSRRHWIFLLIIFGFLLRGPIGLIIPASIVCIYDLLEKKYARFFKFGFSALLILIILTILELALAFQVGGNNFLHDVINLQFLGRMEVDFLPKYYYFTSSIKNYALIYPLSLLVLMGVIVCFPRQKLSAESRLLIKLFAWCVIILVGMSIPGDKKIRYILPIVPALALIVAYPFVNSMHKYFMVLRKSLLYFFLSLPLLFLFVAGFFYAAPPGFHLPIVLNFRLIIWTLIFINGINAILIMNIRKPFAEIFAIGLGACTCVFMYYMAVEPIELAMERGKKFVTTVETLRMKSSAALAFYKERPDSLPIKYIIHMNPKFSFNNIKYIDQADELLQIKTPTFFISSANYFDELPTEISRLFLVIKREKMAHVPVIVFTQKEFQ